VFAGLFEPDFSRITDPDREKKNLIQKAKDNMGRTVGIIALKWDFFFYGFDEK